MDCLTQLTPIAQLFALNGNIQSIAPYGEGHINTTYLVVTDKQRYIMQKMNTRVFPDAKELMSNVCAVTAYLTSRGIETLEVVPLKSGEPFLFGEECYRVYKFIENTISYQTVTDNTVFENSGRAFGNFQNQLADFDASGLGEVILNFHNTPVRYQAFEKALAEDKFDRAKDCKPEIDFLIANKDNLSKIVDGLKDGTIPVRVTHNDTKLNNILMDAVTNEARAIIDLDTIMPGSMLYDFGDSIRFGANTAAEDEKDLDKVHFDLSKFEAYAKGFCSAVKESITQKEIELLPYACFLLTTECGMRFLTDYLQGNVYFATKYETHNLVRCRTQFKLASEIAQNFDKCAKIIENVLK